MSIDDNHLLAELQALVSEGRKIEAIKRYREATGAGLAEAKQAVEARERGQSLPTKEAAAAASSLESEIVPLLQGGNKIEAIKLYRERTGMGLKEAKDAVEAIAADRGIVAPSGSGCLGVVLLLMVISVAAIALAGEQRGGGSRNELTLADALTIIKSKQFVAAFPKPKGGAGFPARVLAILP